MGALEEEMGGEVEFRELWASSDMDVFEKYRVVGTPTIVILDAEGEVAYKQAGVPEEGALKSEIEKARGR